MPLHAAGSQDATDRLLNAFTAIASNEKIARIRTTLMNNFVTGASRFRQGNHFSRE